MKTEQYRIILLAVLAVMAFCLLPNAAMTANRSDLASHPTGTVAYCFDGDTIKLADRRVVRLAGIDTPELGHKGAPAQFYARQSRQELERLCRGRKVRLEAAGVAGKDRYGRLIAEVFLDNGQSINQLMVERGAAFFYPHKDLWPQFQEKLKELQINAISEKRGLWAHLLELPLAAEHFIGNRSSLRFFPSWCRDAQMIKPRNSVNFGGLMDAFMAGYAPARVCVFWPEEH